MKTRFGRLYKKQKGFSLIELLAVILILGIVALIAVPTVNKVIENSRTGAAEDSAKQFVASIGDKLVMEKLHYNIIRNGDYSISELLDLNLNISGTVPDAGFVSISNYQVVDYQLQYGDYVVYPPKKNNVIVDSGQNNGGTVNPGDQAGSQIGENDNQNEQNGSQTGGSSTSEEDDQQLPLVRIFNANDLASGNKDASFVDGYFTIYANSSKIVSVLNTTATTVNGFSFIRTLSLNGAGSYNSYRSISFMANKGDEITVIASSAQSAYLALMKESGIESKHQMSTTAKIYTFTAGETEMYNLLSTASGINIFYIEVNSSSSNGSSSGSSSGETTGESSSGTASDPIVFKPDLNSWNLASNSTYVASVYYNPSTNKKCTESDYLSNKSNADSNSKVLSEGCMFWYVYSDDNNGNLKMLLDHSVDMRSQSDINVVMQYLTGKWQVEPMLFSIEDLSNVIGVNLIDEYNKKIILFGDSLSENESFREVYNIKNSQSALFSKSKWLMSNPYLIFKTSSNPVLPQPVVYNSNNDVTILGIIHNYLRKSLTALSSGSSLNGGSLSGGTIGGGTIGGQIGGGSSSGGLIGGDSSCTGESYYQAGFFLSSPSISDMTFVLGRTDASHYNDDCLNLYSTTDGIVGAYAMPIGTYGIRPVVMVNKSIFE